MKCDQGVKVAAHALIKQVTFLFGAPDADPPARPPANGNDFR